MLTSANPTNYRAGENPKKIMASPNPVPSAYSNLRIRGSEQSPSYIISSMFLKCTLFYFWHKICKMYFFTEEVKKYI